MGDLTNGLGRRGERLAARLRGVPRPGEEDWAERFTGAVFPQDYVELIRRTGPGTLAGLLRLLVPGPDDGSGRLRGFLSEAEEPEHDPPHPDARLWGVFETGETCWWLPYGEDPAHWQIALQGRGRQQLNLTTTEFLDEWLDGVHDLPVLSLPPVAYDRVLTPAGAPVPVTRPDTSAPRDSIAQLQTLIGPGEPASYDWDAIEYAVGVHRLPTDYKRLHESFSGDGQIAVNGFFITHPHHLAAEQERVREFFADIDEAVGPLPYSPDRYALHPTVGGLLACASTESRRLLCWDTRDLNPDNWPVVDLDDLDKVHDYGRPLTELLVAALTGDVPLVDPSDRAWPRRGPRPRP